MKEDTVWVVNPGGRIVEVIVDEGPATRVRSRSTGKVGISLPRNWRLASEDEIKEAKKLAKERFDRDAISKEESDAATSDVKALVSAARELKKPKKARAGK